MRFSLSELYVLSRRVPVGTPSAIIGRANPALRLIPALCEKLHQGDDRLHWVLVSSGGMFLHRQMTCVSIINGPLS